MERDIFQESDELAAKLADEWAIRAKGMPVQDPASSDLLHLPIYDCVSDLYELPCAMRLKELSASGLSGHFRIWADEEARHRTGAVIGPRAHALVDGKEFIDLLSNETQEPGASIARLVRTDPDGWRIIRSRSGMRPSAGALDPQFDVSQIAARPSLWLSRELDLLARWRTQPDWIGACRLCTHRSGLC